MISNEDMNTTTPDDELITLSSTSRRTADASAILLNTTELIQTKFEPKVIDNDKEPEKAVSGKLVYEKKRKKDSGFPSRISRSSIKVGEYMEISLDTKETYRLFQGLKALYDLHAEIGHTPIGSTSYTRIDHSFRQIQTIIQNDPSAARLLGRNDVFDLVKLLLDIISQTDSLEAIEKNLKLLEQSTVSTLTTVLSIERLERVLEVLEKNIDNSSEEFWQKTFEENQWILSQVFSCPCTIFDEKAYVGGKGISNTGGNVCDFIYKNKLTNNIALIEIKTPCTFLFGTQYRSTYSFSTELSGSINQILNYRDKLSKDYYSICSNSENGFEVFNPRCYVVIGKIEGLTRPQIAAIENYRSSISNVTIITFDELIQRAKDMVSLFKEEEIEEDAFEDDIPF